MESMYFFSILFCATIILGPGIFGMNDTNNTGNHTMLYVKVLNYTYPRNSRTFPYTCCRTMPIKNCTHFCETVFSVCVERCEHVLFNITYNFNTNRYYDENYGVGDIVTNITDRKIIIHATEVHTNLNTGTKEIIQADRFTEEYRRPPFSSFWFGRFMSWQLQNRTKIALNVVEFCESGWYNPNKGCSEHIPADDLHEVHYNILLGKLLPELDCKTEETSKINFITHRPYKYTKEILEAQLAKFVADKVCSTRANSITLNIVNVRYNKPLLRVVFSSKCSHDIKANASVAAKDIEVSDLKVTQALSFLSPYEERQYFTDPVSRKDLSSTRDQGRFQIFFRLKQYSNPKGNYYGKVGDNYWHYSCPSDGCMPTFRFSYDGAKHKMQCKQNADLLRDCFGKLVNYQHITVYKDNNIVLHINNTWDKKVPLKLDIYHNNDTYAPIALLRISLESIDAASSSYSTAHSRIVSTTLASTNVRVDVEVMVWCSEGFYGPKCNETCPSNDISCNVPKCTAEVIDTNVSDAFMHCKKGKCMKGNCVCSYGVAGSECGVANIYSLPFVNLSTCIDHTANNACNCINGYTGYNCETDIDDCWNVTCSNQGTCIDQLADHTCNCINGYTGNNCETDIDDCLNVTCTSHSKCIDQEANYVCNCINGYTGNSCETDIDDCWNVTCNNHGSCIDQLANYTCNCINGYTGINCETDIDDCWNVTCYNHGTCIDQLADYTCSCINGYTGINCETDIDDCWNVTCYNNGMCIDQLAYYTCSCINGYTGINCKTDIDDCSNVTCNNHGTCIDQVGNYTCSCINGYTGITCETDIDDCWNVTCNNHGTCIDQVGNYTCNCINGYTGITCETDIDDCRNVTCNNHGTCIDQVGNYKCKCINGYTGNNCETDTDDRWNVTCNNHGTCIDQVANYTCKCINGYTGITCETDIDDCRNVTCNNHGTCIDQVANYTCNCINGLTGNNCEFDIDDCLNVTCNNSDTCIDHVADYTCNCINGLTGNNCETDIDDCWNVTCNNHGTCIDQLANFKCNCINGYTGINCETDIDDCLNVTCNNHGTCIDHVANYTCSCLTGYDGRNCEFDVDKCSSLTCGGRGLQLEDGIYSRCTSSGWNITVNMTVLKQLYPTITRRNIHFGDSFCLGREVGNLLMFQQGFGECLTSKRISGNTLLYVNDLFYAIYDPLKLFIIRQYKWTYTVECDVNRNEATSSHVHHDVDTHHTAITGHYNINMTFFKDVNFMNQLPGNPLHANVGDDIYVKVFTTATDWTIKMRLHTCYTKPSDVADTKTIYYIIKDGCEVDSNTHIISQSTHETKFMFQDFVFSSNREGLNIYCNATFCETKDFSAGCAQSCSSPGTHALVGK